MSNWYLDMPHTSSGWETLKEKGLCIDERNFWVLTDRGREVLANLNAMCKAEK